MKLVPPCFCIRLLSVCIVVSIQCLCGTQNATAQPILRLDTAQTAVGEKCSLVVRFATDGSGTMNGAPSGRVVLLANLVISNPTIFYPETIRAPLGSVLSEHSLNRRNDTTYTISCTVQRPAAGANTSRDTLCIVEGLALAGSDSVSRVRLGNITLVVSGQSSMPPAVQSVIQAQSLGGVLYVRFAKLEASVPNPAARNTPVVWAYRIDRESDVSLRIYNALGQEVKNLQQGFKQKGYHTITLFPSEGDFGAGVYWARLVTKSGEDVKPFHVIE